MPRFSLGVCDSRAFTHELCCFMHLGGRYLGLYTNSLPYLECFRLFWPSLLFFCLTYTSSPASPFPASVHFRHTVFSQHLKMSLSCHLPFVYDKKSALILRSFINVFFKDSNSEIWAWWALVFFVFILLGVYFELLGWIFGIIVFIRLGIFQPLFKKNICVPPNSLLLFLPLPSVKLLDIVTQVPGRLLFLFLVFFPLSKDWIARS